MNTEEYSHESGALIPNSGHILVNITISKAVVRYIHSVNNHLKKPSFQNGDVAFEYEINTGELK